MNPKRILVIQTAFIGDVILATSTVETLKSEFPESEIDFLVRKGNETLFENNPNVSALLVWDKKQNKLSNLFKIIREARSNQYDLLINIQRYLSTGLVALFSGAKHKIGFTQNPMSFCYDRKIQHDMSQGIHEIHRNHELIDHIVSNEPKMPKLYPSQDQIDAVSEYKSEDYITIAPASVWYTKQYPKEKWIEFLSHTEFKGKVYLLGAPNDVELSDEIISKTSREDVINLCGKVSFLESAALMKDAKMNYVNDSAPLHICSAMNAPVTAIYCSTVPNFGFGPLSDNSRIVEAYKELKCRPCGFHGHKQCPEGHFKCGYIINLD